MPRGKDGSIIGVAPSVSTSSASGIWTMSEVHKYETEGTWPVTWPDGGTIIEPASYYSNSHRSHTFLVSGDTFDVLGAITCDVFMAGGGGHGGDGGGGGAGAFRAWTGVVFPAGTYAITRGVGGPATLTPAAATNASVGAGDGGASTIVQSSGTGFTTMTAEGGGQGSYSSSNNATNGGSGGGGTAQASVGYYTAGSGNKGGDTATINSGSVVTPAVSGYAGGLGYNGDYMGSGGGGGASAVGVAGLSGSVVGGSGVGGDGGAFRTNFFRDGVSGSTTAFHRFCGGGGGSGMLAGGGGADDGDGGGAGATAGTYSGGQASAATANSGSGGGGGQSNTGGGAGGSGIVVIRYTA